MKNEPENPPAFPRSGLPQSGMTLRDYFAAKATEEDIAPYMVAERDPITGYFPPIPCREAAKFIYADAMLAARQKEGK